MVRSWKTSLALDMLDNEAMTKTGEVTHKQLGSKHNSVDMLYDDGERLALVSLQGSQQNK